MPTPVTPLLSVDIIIELLDYEPYSIVLIERRFAPFGWALPGGFVDLGERLEQAAMREAREETGLEVTLSVLLGCYSDPTRDPRGHTVSAVYVATARGEPHAQDDAKTIAVVNATTFQAELPERPMSMNMVFDHTLILADYVHYRQTAQLTPLRINGD